MSDSNGITKQKGNSMSRETLADLNANTLIGMTGRDGTAWHWDGVTGNQYAGPVPIKDVRKRLLSGWDIESQPLTVEHNGERVPLTVGGTQMKAYVRTDNGRGLGIFTDGHAGHGYDEWLLKTPGAILDADLVIGSAGLLREGAVMWVSVEMKETMEAPGDVKYLPRLLCSTSFNGSLATSFRLVNQIVVCDNTLDIGLSENGPMFKVKHTKNSAAKIGSAREALSIIHANSAAFDAEIERLTSTVVTDEAFAAFLDAIKPVPEAVPTKGGGNGRGWTMATKYREAVTALYNNDPRVAPWQGSAFGVLQAVNTYRLHDSQVKGDAHTRSERNMLDTLTGKGADADNGTLEALARVLATV